MGVGHVPPGPLPEEGAGPHLPRRQRRGAGAPGAALTPAELARLGERAAAEFLCARGAELLARNPRSGRGEIDLLVRFGRERTAVEVKTRTEGGIDPAEGFTPEKLARVRRAAAALSARRVDLVAVTVGDGGVRVRWLPRAG